MTAVKMNEKLHRVPDKKGPL